MRRVLHDRRLLAEWLAFTATGVLTAMGWRTLFAQKIFAGWLLDFVFAFSVGLVFQSLALAPMRNLSFATGLFASLKVDTLSLASWQVGMYGFMAVAQFGLFEHCLHTQVRVNMPESGSRCNSRCKRFWPPHFR